MPLQLPSRATVLFQGDSITDADRVIHPTDELGHGYAGMSAELLRTAHPDSDFTFVNRGVSGNRIADLRARWHEDGVALDPDLVSVMIGVNDTWRRYEGGVLTTTEAYEDDYRHILTRIRRAAAPNSSSSNPSWSRCAPSSGPGGRTSTRGSTWCAGSPRSSAPNSSRPTACSTRPPGARAAPPISPGTVCTPRRSATACWPKPGWNWSRAEPFPGRMDGATGGVLDGAAARVTAPVLDR